MRENLIPRTVFLCELFFDRSMEELCTSMLSNSYL